MCVCVCVCVCVFAAAYVMRTFFIERSGNLIYQFLLRLEVLLFGSAVSPSTCWNNCLSDTLALPLNVPHVISLAVNLLLSARSV